MQHAGVEALLGRQMSHTRDERLPERPIIGPFGKDFVDGRVVNRGFALGVLRYGQTLPLHPGVEHPEDDVPFTTQTCLSFDVIPYGQNIRTHLSTGSDASLIACPSACLPLSSNPYSEQNL